jgi:hypothetical protein
LTLLRRMARPAARQGGNITARHRAGRDDRITVCLLATFVNPQSIGLMERLGARFTRMPTVREALPAGDFRDWAAIETWAEGIARELQQIPAATAAPA